MKEYKDNNERLRSETQRRAQKLMKKKLPYEKLCQELAELLVFYEKSRNLYSELDVSQKAEIISETAPKYEEVCLMIGLYQSYLEQEYLFP